MFKKRKKGTKRKNAIMLSSTTGVVSDTAADKSKDTINEPAKKKAKKIKPTIINTFGDDEEGEESSTFKLKRSKKKKRKMMQAASLNVNMAAEADSATNTTTDAPTVNKYSKEALAKLKSQQQIYVAPPSPERVDLMEESVNAIFHNTGEDIDNEDPMISVQIERAKMKRQQARSGDVIPLSYVDSTPTTTDKNNAVNAVTRDIAMNRGVSSSSAVDRWEMELIKRGGTSRDVKRAKGGTISYTEGAYTATTAVKVDMSQRLTVDQIMAKLKSKLVLVEEDVRSEERLSKQLESDLESVQSETIAHTATIDAAQKKHRFFSELRDNVEDISGCLTAKRGMVKEVEQAMFTARTEAFRLLHKEQIIGMNTTGDVKPERVKEIVSALQRRLAEIKEGAVLVFEDVYTDLQSAAFTRDIFEEWANTYPDEYKTAYAALSLPDFVEMYARLEMCVVWDPVNQLQLPSFNPSLDQFDWYQLFFSYGEGNAGAVVGDKDNEQVKDVIPEMIKRVMFPLLEEHIKASWSPLIPHETTALVTTLDELLLFEPPKETLTSLVKVMLTRIEEIQDELSLPLDRHNPLHVTFVENIESLEKFIPQELIDKLAI